MADSSSDIDTDTFKSNFKTMDKLEELYFTAFNYNCFKEVYKRGIWDLLGDCLQFPQDPILENTDVDAKLLALTVIQKFYQRLQTVQCAYLKIITDDLVSKGHLVDCLLKHLDHRNQHVVFSATKTIVLIFQVLSKQMIKEEWFVKLFDFGQESEQPWKKLYVMEMLNKIIKNSRETQKNPVNCQQDAECMGDVTCSCTPAEDSLIATTFSSYEVVELFLGNVNLQHILILYLPFIVRPNGMYSFIKSCQQMGPAKDLIVLQASLKLGDAIHDQENVKREAISGTKENNLVAFLCCIAEVAKYVNVKSATCLDDSAADLKSYRQEENSFLRSQGFGSTDCSKHNTVELCKGKTNDICAAEMRTIDAKDASVNQLFVVVATLTQYLHYPRLPSLIFKKILEILNQVLFIPSSVLFTPKNECSKLQKILRSSSVSFLSIVECCLLAKIPRCPAICGFSGTEIKHPPGLAGKMENTDVVALKKASLLVFKSSFVVLKSAIEQEGSLLLQKLAISCISLWCSGILYLTSGTPSNNKSTEQNSSERELHNCLVTLFVDQDDELVEVMLLLLFLFQEIHRTVPSSEISRNILRQLNPHWLFAAFTESVEFDHSLLLDLLISSETRFLEYLVKYLRFVVSDWDAFTQSLATYKGVFSCCEEEDEAISDDLKTCSFRQSEFECQKPVEVEGAEEDVVSLKDSCRPQLLKTFPTSQKDDGERCCNHCGKMAENSSEIRFSDSCVLGNHSGQPESGLKNIVQSYCSSDESDMEIEGENEISNTTAACVCKGSNNGKLHTLTFNKNSAEVQHDSPFSNTSHSVLVPDISFEIFDKVMTMLIRLRMSMARLSSGGHFPYSAAPLIVLIENVEKCYDGC